MELDREQTICMERNTQNLSKIADNSVELRDRLAIAVLTGTMTTNWGAYFRDEKQLAKYCYNIADAMLEVRSEK